jgi:nucleoid-associated protein YgaU
MKKIFFCFLLILSIFVFFACATTQPAPTPEPVTQPVTVTTPAAPVPVVTPQPIVTTPVPTPVYSTNDLILSGAETYTVVRGDTLTKIARSKYGNGFYYPLILMASSSIVKDQDKIIPGMRLTIPKLQVNLDDSRAKASLKRFILETASITERKRPRDAAGLRNLANTL